MAQLSTFANFVPTEEVIEVGGTTIVESPIVETVVEMPIVAAAEEKLEANESDFKLSDEPTPTVPIIESTPIVPISWKEAIKGVDKKEAAKELGITDFALELNDYMERGGSAADYINAKGIDWGSVADVDLIVSDMKKEFPKATDQQLQRMIAKKYNQTEFAEDEDKEDGLLLLERDANKLRQEKISQQQSFKIPDAIIPETIKTQQDFDLQMKAAQEQHQKEQEQIIQFYQNSEATKNLMTSKRVAIDLGDNGKFNFKIDKPELVTEAITNAEVWQKLTSTPQGEPDVLKQQLISLFAFNPQKFASELVNFGKSLGEEKFVVEGQNAKKPNGVLASMVEEKPTYSIGKGGQTRT